CRAFQDSRSVLRADEENVMSTESRYHCLVGEYGADVVEQLYVRIYSLMRKGGQSNPVFVQFARPGEQFLNCNVEMRSSFRLLHGAPGQSATKDYVDKEIIFDAKSKVLVYEFFEQLP